jgi:hypothetical protein
MLSVTPCMMKKWAEMHGCKRRRRIWRGVFPANYAFRRDWPQADTPP